MMIMSMVTGHMPFEVRTRLDFSTFRLWGTGGGVVASLCVDMGERRDIFICGGDINDLI